MNFNRRETLGLIAVGAISIACPVRAADKRDVFLLIPDSGSAFYTQSANFMKPILEHGGFNLNVLDASMKADVQLNQIDNVINLSPAAIVIAAVDFDALGPGIDKAREAGIKVIAYDRGITNTVVDFTSVAGVGEMGRICARHMIELLKTRKGKTAGRILQIMGDPGDNYAVQLRDGFGDIMKDYPEVEVVTQAAHAWEPTVAANIAQDYLASTENVDGIFLASGYFSAAVVGVLETLAIKPGDLIIVDGDGDAAGFPLIKNGWQDAAVEAPLYAESYAVVAFLDQVLKGEKIAEGQYEILGLKSDLKNESWGPTISIPGRVITSANVGDDALWGNRVLPDVKYQQATDLLIKGK